MDLLQSGLLPGSADILCCGMPHWLHAAPCHPSLAATLLALEHALLLLAKCPMCPFVAG